MKVLKGYTDYKIIGEDSHQFPAKGMLGPSFFNQGNTIAMVNGDEVYPGEHFTTPENVIQDGTFNISFKMPDNPPATPVNRVKVVFTMITGEIETNPPQKC